MLLCGAVHYIDTAGGARTSADRMCAVVRYNNISSKADPGDIFIVHDEKSSYDTPLLGRNHRPGAPDHKGTLVSDLKGARPPPLHVVMLSCWCYETEFEFWSLMAWEKKLLLSLSCYGSTCQMAVKWRDGYQGDLSPWWSWQLCFCSVWGRCPAERGAHNSAGLCSPDWSHFHTTLRCWKLRIAENFLFKESVLTHALCTPLKCFLHQQSLCFISYEANLY